MIVRTVLRPTSDLGVPTRLSRRAGAPCFSSSCTLDQSISSEWGLTTGIRLYLKIRTGLMLLIVGDWVNVTSGCTLTFEMVFVCRRLGWQRLLAVIKGSFVHLALCFGFREVSLDQVQLFLKDFSPLVRGFLAQGTKEPVELDVQVALLKVPLLHFGGESFELDFDFAMSIFFGKRDIIHGFG